MKKITIVLGIAFFIMATLMNTNSINSFNKVLTLKNLTLINNANAEAVGGYGPFENYSEAWFHFCYDHNGNHEGTGSECSYQLGGSCSPYVCAINI
jgi:hypothetical protein